MPARIGMLLRAALVLAASLPAAGQTPQRRMIFRESVPNLHAPELYARFLRLRITLVDLPGAAAPESDWEMSYRLYYVSEANFTRVLRGRPGGAWGHSAEDFPGRVLLGEGSFRRGPLSGPQDRAFLSPPIAFKSKVADRDRTKFARLLLSYSLKISDGRLNSTLYKSGIFLDDPFITVGGRDVARSDFYLSFLVTPEGRLNASILPQDAANGRW